MAFQPIEPRESLLAYRTTADKRKPHGLELVFLLAPDLLEEAGIEPGTRCMIEIDADEGLARVVSGSQHGWLLKPTTGNASTYRLRLTWKPTCGFPESADRSTLRILQSDGGEIIFKMPTEGGAE